MTSRYKKIQDLAAEWNCDVDNAVRILQEKRVRVIEGWYDAALLDAVFKETYVAGKRRTASGLSPRLGLGCVYSLLTRLNIAVSIHDPRGAQWLMLRHDDQSTYVKWYYTNRMQPKRGFCKFHVRGFNTDQAPSHYLFTCFDGPLGWALSSKTLQNMWRDLQAKKDVTAARLVKGFETYEAGALNILLAVENTPYMLSDRKQLGFK